MENNVLLRYWKTHSMRDLTVFLAVAAVAALVIANLSGNESLRVISDVLGLVDVLHYFIHGYFYHQHRFLTDYLHTYSLPRKKIARCGAGYFGVFMLLLVVGIAVVRELYVGTLVAKLQALFTYVLGSVFGFLLGHDGLDNGPLILQNKTSLLDMMNQVAHKEASAWDGIINAIQSVLIVVGVTVIIVLAVGAAIGAVKRMITGVRTEGSSDRVSQTSDTEQALGRTRIKRDNPFDQSPTARIRRTYRKTINRQRRRGQAVPDWMTPAEIESMVELPRQEQYRQLHTVYEKARYSQEGCTDEDVRLAKAVKV